MNTMSKRETSGSPLNFEWSEDLMDPKTKLDVLDRFMDGNDGSLAGEENLHFSIISKSDDLDKPKSITLESRKRSLSSNNSQLSEASTTILRRKKKPKGMPKRPLSAYNLFFQSERMKIQDAAEGAGERIGFEGLGKIIGKKWQELTPSDRKMYERLAEKDTVRYRKEMEAYNEIKAKKMEEEDRIACSASLVESMLEKDAAGSSATHFNHSGTSFLQQTSSARQSEAFVMAAEPQSLPIQSQEEFSRLHAMTAPLAPSPFSPPPQQPERPPVDCMPSVVYRSQYDGNVQRVAAPNSTHVISMPAPPPGAERVPAPNSFHMPPGMEIVLSDRAGQDRRYRVKYTCYSMSREAARKYIEGLSGAQSDERRSQPPASPQHQHMEVNGGVVMQGPQLSLFQAPGGWSNY